MRAPTVGAFGDGAFDVDTERADVGIGPYGVLSAMVHPTRRCALGCLIQRQPFFVSRVSIAVQ